MATKLHWTVPRPNIWASWPLGQTSSPSHIYQGHGTISQNNFDHVLFSIGIVFTFHDKIIQTIICFKKSNRNAETNFLRQKFSSTLLTSNLYVYSLSGIGFWILFRKHGIKESGTKKITCNGCIFTWLGFYESGMTAAY